jgi:uncharacterized protein with NRDE domain
MCLVAFAIGASQHWPLVIAANRDEFWSRPTLPLAGWQTTSGQKIISGRDLRAGGAWLGMTPGGRVAFLTNVRQAEVHPAARSRGELVTRWLDASSDAASFVATLKKGSGVYGGFNLVLGDFRQNSWTWVTNQSTATASGWQAQALPPGVYGLSNAALDTPWPKTVDLKRVLSLALANQENSPNPDALFASLWTALDSRERAAVANLPSTGVSLAFEKALSSAFVEFSEQAYGTRCSTVLLVSEKDFGNSVQRQRVQMEERTFLRTEMAEAVTNYCVDVKTALESFELVI